MELCTDCAAKKKHRDLFKAMDTLDTEIMYLEELRDIMTDMSMERPPPFYLYRRVEEHVETVRTLFETCRDIAFDRKSAGRNGDF